MTGFARRVLGLQEVFPSSGIAAAQPAEVADTVSLVHRWPSAKASIDRTELVIGQSTTVVTPILTVLFIPQGRWAEILFGDLAHSSATPRDINLFIQYANQLVAVARWTNMASGAAVPGQPSGQEPMVSGASAYSSALASDRMLPPWPLVLPPGSNLDFRGNTAGAAYEISCRLLVITHPLAEDSAIGAG